MIAIIDNKNFIPLCCFPKQPITLTGYKTFDYNGDKMSELIPFPEPDSLDELVEKTHKLAEDSANVSWGSPHVQQRMRERNVSIRQIFDVLRHGKGIDGPTLDKYGDWRIKLKRFTAGRVVQVVAVVKSDHLEIVTVI